MRTTDFSRKCFFQALMRLNEAMPYDQISVADICREAGYNRSTFYRVYPSKEALLLDGFRREYALGYYGTVPAGGTGLGEEYVRNVRLLFAFIRENHRFFEMMRDAHLVEEMYSLFADNFPHHEEETEFERMQREFLAAGYLAVIYDWLDGGMEQSDGQMARHIASIIEHSTIY